MSNISTAVDLFSGGGGLTVGLKNAGFSVVSAVELEPNAFNTYKINHPEVSVFNKDIKTISGDKFLEASPTGMVDLVAGCPPCQGFSSLTSKYRRFDPRNELIFEMYRVIEQLKPKIIMMENVPGLAQKGKELFEEFLRRISELGYMYEWRVLQVADYGVPQTRRRLVLLAGKGFHIPFPEPTHSRTGENDLPLWRTLRDAISDMPEPVTLSQTKKLGGPKNAKWHVVRDMSAQNIKRLKKAIPGESWRKIPKKLRPDCHKDIEAGFPNVYGRLSWDKPSGTITGGCTTLSKGRFGHPEELRTISVREAALLQTFPPDYIIDTDYMEKACMIVGNALPCTFAEVLARRCFEALRQNE
ncbi:cytosine methyltransferase [Tumebacillus flagellatus]|uniref:Cytosine-specific methyltransferase n=1 Tax=Tumebacillus flagellatus TaxID=1157490 RepID=A0A074LN70_9BACL|nr:cytosine methyltransferase [Tumebacillus flagellatus]